MNILYLCDEYPPGRHGGIGTVVQLLAREMVKQGHNVIVCGFYEWGYGGQDEFEDMGVKVFRFRRGLDTNLLKNKEALPVRAAYRILKDTGIFQWDIERSLKKYQAFVEALIRRYSIDLIEMADFNDYIRFIKTYTPFPKFSVPVIVKLHGSLTFIDDGKNLPVQIYKTEAQILEQADAVISVSRYNANKTAEYFEYGKKIEVLYNGINAQFDTKHIVKIKNKVIFTGALVEKKGIYNLMEAWNIVNRNAPDATLTVLGKGPAEKVKARLNSEAMKSVTFLGHVPRAEVLKQLSSATIGVFPSYVESFSLAVLEAMACAVTVINTELAAGPEITENGITGYLVDPKNAKQIADCIIYLLQNPEECHIVGNKGRQHVLDKFDISVIAKQHINFYQSVYKRTFKP